MRTLAISATLTMCLFSTNATAQTLQQIVDSFYPVERLSRATPEDRRTCAQVLNATTSGTPVTVVAGYSDGEKGLLRLLTSGTSGTFSVSYETPAELGTNGFACELRLIDFDGDGRSDVWFEVSVGAAGIPSGWAFIWDGGITLTNVTPTEVLGSLLWSKFDGAEPTDLAHDGRIRIIAGGQRGGDTAESLPSRIYDLPVGTAMYRLEKYIVTSFYFQVGDADFLPLVDFPFNVIQDSTGPYVIRVTNGDGGNMNRVVTGSITINGTEIIGPTQLNSQTEFVQATIPALNIHNNLRVAITGNPQARITITIEDSTVRP